LTEANQDVLHLDISVATIYLLVPPRIEVESRAEKRKGGATRQLEARLSTNIVLCSDGTGNSTIKNRGTNVYTLFEAVDIEPSPGESQQIAFYDDGVGTGSLRFMRAFGGAFGFGFARNLRDLYQSPRPCVSSGRLHLPLRLQPRRLHGTGASRPHHHLRDRPGQ
jgi:hypothetical protein